MNLIGSPPTQSGLTVGARLDRSTYKTDIKATDEEMLRLNHSRSSSCSEWNYKIQPRLIS